MKSRQRTGAKSSKRKGVAKVSAKAGAGATGNVVATWEDDPGSPTLQPPLVPITVTAPDQAAQPLPFKIAGTKPPPKVYQAGTSNFRFYAAASALRRTGNFWGSIVPGNTVGGRQDPAG